MNTLVPERNRYYAIPGYSQGDPAEESGAEPSLLHLLLGDRTGEIEAKMWDNVAEVMDTFDRDDFVKVKGLPQIYQNKPQLTVHKQCLEDHEVEPGDYFPRPSAIRRRCGRSLRGIISSLGQYCGGCSEEIFADPAGSGAVQARTGRKIDPPRLPGRSDEHALSSRALAG